MLILQLIVLFIIYSIFSSIFRLLNFGNGDSHTNYLIEVEIKNSMNNPANNFRLEISEVDKLNAVAQMRFLGKGQLDDDDFYHTDSFLLRWLKDTDFNLTIATRMAMRAKNWRLKNRIDDSILNETIVTLPVHPFTFEGFDKEGHPLAFINIKLIDARKFVLTMKHEDLIRAWIQILETGFNVLKQSNLAKENPSEGMVGIVDAAGANFKQHMCFPCISAYIEGAHILANYYPGIAHRIIAVNVNKVGLAFFKLVTPIISPKMYNSVKLFGTNRTEWVEYLLSVISPDQLPRYYGRMKIT